MKLSKALRKSFYKLLEERLTAPIVPPILKAIMKRKNGK